MTPHDWLMLNTGIFIGSFIATMIEKWKHRNRPKVEVIITQK